MGLEMALALVLATTRLQSEDRFPVPDETALKQAEKLVKDLFKEEYAKKSPNARALLADKMLEQARQVKDDQPSQYVLFREAQDLLAQAGEVERGFRAIDEWAGVFAIDSLDLKSRTLATVAKTPKTPEEMKNLTIVYLKLVDSAVAMDLYEVAEKTVQATLAAARKANSPSLSGRATAKAKEVSDLKGRFEKVRKARETLKSSPDDGPANLVVGQFECLVKGNWDAGLPVLSKGSQETLSATARRDLEQPGDASSQSALADSWWDLAEKDAASARQHLRARAFFWYEKAVLKLTGLGKSKVERRLLDYRLEKVHRGTWLDISDPKVYGRTGAPGSPLEVDRKQWLKLAKPPPGEFDGYSVKVKLLSNDALPNVQHEPGKHMVVLSATSPHWTVSRNDGTGWSQLHVGDLPTADEWTVTILVEGAEQVIFVDGVEIYRIQTVSDKLPLPGLIMHEGRASFAQMKLRKKE